MNKKEMKELGSIIGDRFSTLNEKCERVIKWIEEKDESLRNRFRGRIEAYCEVILDGRRPCAMIPIPDKYTPYALGIVHDCRLRGYLETTDQPEWAKLWIYKRDFMFEVIKHLPDKPKTAYEAWILGKAFNYSDETIERFCKDKL